MEWCCVVFQDLVSRAGTRGMSVVPTVRTGKAVFFLQARAVTPEVTEINLDFPIALASQQAIGHCPGCGEDLSDWYSNDMNTIRRDDLVLC